MKKPKENFPMTRKQALERVYDQGASLQRLIVKQKETDEKSALSRAKRKGYQNEDVFYIQPEGKVPGMEYRWLAVSIDKEGKEKLLENIEQASKDGWLPLSASKNPLLMTDGRARYSFDDYIMDAGMLLVGRIETKSIENENKFVIGDGKSLTVINNPAWEEMEE